MFRSQEWEGKGGCVTKLERACEKLSERRMNERKTVHHPHLHHDSKFPIMGVQPAAGDSIHSQDTFPAVRRGFPSVRQTVLRSTVVKANMPVFEPS